MLVETGREQWSRGSFKQWYHSLKLSKNALFFVQKGKQKLVSKWSQTVVSNLASVSKYMDKLVQLWSECLKVHLNSGLSWQLFLKAPGFVDQEVKGGLKQLSQTRQFFWLKREAKASPQQVAFCLALSHPAVPLSSW